MNGVIKYWNDERGYGFISCGIHQYFVHHTNVQRGFRPVVNCRVSFELGPGKKPGTEQAINVRIHDDATTLFTAFKKESGGAQ